MKNLVCFVICLFFWGSVLMSSDHGFQVIAAAKSDPATALLETKLEMLRKEMLAKGVDPELLESRLGNNQVDSEQAQSMKNTFERTIRPHFDGLQKLGSAMGKEVTRQQESMQEVDAAMKKVEEVLQSLSDATTKFGTDLGKLTDLIDQVQNMGQKMIEVQNSLRNELRTASSGVKSVAEKSSSRAIWAFLMLFEILAVVGFFYYKRVRSEKRLSKMF
mmetsp:Transcript_7720/g.14022  ORF Transcript_7720/g.14022 Transcript_7720/m.14022 type:complete len:218 (-) Transcript_7720:73-726(-)